MPRTKASLLTDLSTADLKRLLAARERIDTLEKEKGQLLKALTAVDRELDRLMGEATGRKPARKKAVRRKTAKKVAKKVGRKVKKKTARKVTKKVTKKVAKKTAKKAAKKTTKKIVRKAPARKSTAKKAAPKVRLEDVVAAVITKQKKPVTFKDLYAKIVKGKLFKSKSKNFDNVLRRTLSTSKKIKRVGRGLYDVA